MTTCRKIPFLTFVMSPRRKVKINLSGCNFDCRGCFAIAKRETGKDFSVKGLLNLLNKSSRFLYNEMVDDVQMTGGEPTIDRNYLLSLIRGLRELRVSRIGVSTNGYLLNRKFVEELKFLDVNYIKLDVKAYTDKIHRWYTGKGNAKVLRAAELLHKYGLNFYVRTIYIPDVTDSDEIAKIAKFLSGVDKSISYKIYQFAPEQLDDCILRGTTKEEMLTAFYAAREYLDNVEFYTTETAYKPAPYKCIEVRADELLEKFKRIDEISKSVIDNWDMEYFSMSQILSSGMESQNHVPLKIAH